MATYTKKLADSLQVLHKLQKKERLVFRANSLTRTHLERLVLAGYLQPIVKGWYMSSRPQEKPGGTTSWYASFSDFVRGYCDDRFGKDWHVNAEISLLLHTGSTTLPLQIIVSAKKGKNNLLNLPAGCSLWDSAAKDFPSANLITEAQGLRALTLETALVRAAPNLWITDPQTLHLALGQLPDVDQLSRLLLDGGNSVIAGRLAGALDAVGKSDLATELVENMQAAGYVVVKSNPFNVPVALIRSFPESPYCARIRTMWIEMREQVLNTWTVPKRSAVDSAVYLTQAEKCYVNDAYSSLSIEGYQVTPELIEKVRSGEWSPDKDDQNNHNALAARGYYEAHLKVVESLTDVLEGKNAGNVLRQDLPHWYRALWAPSLRAGIFKPSDLTGWRSSQVYIQHSKHIPLPPDAIRDAMPVLFELLTHETEPQVQAVLGHFIFVFIHPYMDGNGRLARFILNLMLARGGWPWVIVTLDMRKRYMDALEEASVRKNIQPFTILINELLMQQSSAAPAKSTKQIKQTNSTYLG